MKKILLSCYLISSTAFAVVMPHYSKKWNCMTYISNNNNLYRYGIQNIKEMSEVGSTAYINIFAQRDNYGKKEATRFKIEKNEQKIISVITTPPESISGTVESLFGFTKEIITKHPADHNALIVWNHGSGIKDPQIWAKNYFSERDECFFLNEETHFFELKKDLLETTPILGIAFNDVAHTYLTNQDLKLALDRISKELLGGKKIDILGLDACHMSMIEICSQVKSAVDYVVGSEEIEPGTGWGYSTLFQPFLQNSLTPEGFAKKIVDAYDNKYNQSFADFTQSAIRMDKIPQLEQNIDTVSTLLITLINDPLFYKMLTDVRRSNTETITFLDQDYIDLSFFYKSLTLALQRTKLEQNEDKIAALKQALTEGVSKISACVIKNAVGKNVGDAGGLAIYFPTRNIHNSYANTEFAKTTNWYNFLTTYLRVKNTKQTDKQEKAVTNSTEAVSAKSTEEIAETPVIKEQA